MFNRRYARKEARLRRKCEEQLRGIEISDPYAVDEICHQLAVKRGRPLYLHELPDPGGVNAPCGLVISFESGDHIFHVAAVSERHRAQIVRHELAHLLLGHTSENASVVESLLSVMPQGVDASAVLTALGRTSYDSEAEYDAELAASSLGELFEELAHSGRAPGRSGAVTRLDDALAHPRRNRRS
ncbi:secondary metabolite protein [Streptomyces verrucosisporus]|uniref:secondary metabolite protein n=1 Tax=Streptomyces verrucosisporus TaxID=1695161 RepID=UPI0019D2F952|nr:secondary metabolite protein [Streptomyces verrucosisporus]MBN3932978.1 secondary metabolite protein [Streptomyces verrucosisporus]